MHKDCRKRHEFCEKKELQNTRPSRQPVMRALCFKNMIKDRNISETLIASAQKASGIINDSLFEVMNNCSQEEFKKYRLAVGHAMYEIYERIVKPLSTEHPDLDPLKKGSFEK